MIPLHRLKNDPEAAIKALDKRDMNAHDLVYKVLDLDEQRRSTQQQLDDTLARSRRLSKEVGQYFKEGRHEEGEQAKAESTRLKTQSQELQESLRDLEQQIRNTLLDLPNLPHTDVPKGASDEDNVEVRRGGPEAEAMPEGKPHWELASQFNLIDFEQGNAITGSGFPVYKGKGARLQRAMINYFLDKATAAGYQEFQPPLLVNEQTGFGTGQLPDKEGQMYQLADQQFYLIPTAEVPLTNYYRNAILAQEDFPVQMTAYTPCFRREAGSYGKEVRGLNRLHQFDKVEIVQIEHPDRSYQTLNRMISYVEDLIQELGLSYRILRLCGGDLGFAAAITYDIEVYAPAQQKWMEVSSISNFEDYQANRMQLRYRETDKKTALAHTLNGSALAFPRLLAALMEFCQTENGIQLPEPLASYAGFTVLDA